MSQINPFAPAIAGTPMAQRQQSADKTQQIRRRQILSKSAIVTDDEFEHQVENADRISGVQDQGSNANQQHQPKKNTHPPADDEQPHLDITG